MKGKTTSVFNSIVETKSLGVASLGEIIESIRTGSIFQKDFSSTIEEIKSLLATGQIDEGRIRKYCKKRLLTFMNDKYEDITSDVIEKQYDTWRKNNVNKYNFFQNGKFSYISKCSV
jgi:hypothetical protein